MKKSTVLLLVLSAALVFTCKKKDKDADQSECEKNPSTFSAKAKPVIDAKCATAGCHAAGTNNGPGPLTNYTQVKNASDRIKVSVTNGSMPKNGSLSQAEKDAILCWIDSGAENN